MAACGLGLSSVADVDLPTPQSVGFHHCALIYERPVRSRADLLPYVTHVTSGKPRAWLFDAFLFLHFTALSGVRTDDGPTKRSDWQYQLDQWFAPARDLHALDEAIAEAARHLGKPPRPRMVLLTMPYPNPAVRDFGAGKDGTSPDLSDLNDVRLAARWYVDEAVRRFEEARFRHLELWGIYWMREEMPPSDEERVRVVADVVHAAGLRFAWIPWFRAQGYERWKSVGFDAAFLQPNYAFHAWTHGGSVRRNRLATAVDLARKHGLGVEMEAGDVVQSDADRLAFLHYLCDGAPDRLDYQRSAMAYYLGTDTVERISRAKSPKDRAVYEALARFITGRPVADPSPQVALRRDGETIQIRLDRAQHISHLDLLLTEPDCATAWTGHVEVFVRSSSRGAWRPGGWAIRAGHDATAGSRQVISVPIGQVAAELRVVARSPSRQPFLPERIVPETLVREAPRSHAARGCAYVLAPRTSGIYDDDGTKLTDGIEAERGFSEGRSVGWVAPQVAVTFDLGVARRVDRVEVACQGGSYGNVNWPAEAILMVAADSAPPASVAAPGPLPHGFRWVAGSEPRVTRQRSATDIDGVISFVLDPPAQSRYVTLAFRPAGWLMISEVRVMDGSINAARQPGVRYTLRPWPTPAPAIAAQYADDGVRLTDGVVALGLNRMQITGWDRDDRRQVVLDLGATRPVSSVIVWTLAGGGAAVYAPSRVTLEASDDGVSWTALESPVRKPVVEDGHKCEALPWTVRMDKPVRCRFIRGTVERARGWVMVSEIEVHTAAGTVPR